MTLPLTLFVNNYVFVRVRFLRTALVFVINFGLRIRENTAEYASHYKPSKTAEQLKAECETLGGGGPYGVSGLTSVASQWPAARAPLNSR